MSEKPSFFAELKRRNVYKVAVAYAVVSWLLIQVATQVFPFFEIPNWAVRLVVLLLILGFPVGWPDDCCGRNRCRAIGVSAGTFKVRSHASTRNAAGGEAGLSKRGGYSFGKIDCCPSIR